MKSKILLVAITMFFITSCSSVKKENSKIIEGEIFHTVYFWLNNPDNSEEVAYLKKK